MNSITACIEAINGSRLDPDNQLEILVIDGESDDGTVGLLDELNQKHKNLHVINNPDRITPVAFNMGIQAAIGEYIQIVGARQLISENYIQRCLDFLTENPSVKCVGGRVENIYTNEISECIGIAMSSPFGVGGGNFRTINETRQVDTVGTPFYEKKIFDKIGLFDPELVRNQDDELNFRLTKAGYQIYILHDISIKYYVRADFGKLSRQYYQYGYWKVYVNKKHGLITSIRQLFPALLIKGTAIGFLLGFLWSGFAVITAGVLVVYLLCCVLFAVMGSKSARQIAPVSFTFLVLHFSYGYGYLWGIMDFIVLRKGPRSKSKVLSR